MAYPLQQGEHFTYRDLLTWPESERWELIDGVAYDMSPAPATTHQQISIALASHLYLFLIGKPCQVFTAPFDVLLPKGNEADEDVDTVVEPDIVVVCDPNKLTKRGCTGAPDLVIEILSPRTAKKDQREKLYTYQRAGVREYWVINPADHTVTIFKLGDNGRYNLPEVYFPDESVVVGVLEGLTIDLAQVFARQISEDADANR